MREQTRSPSVLLHPEENSFVRRTYSLDSRRYGPARRRHPVRLLRRRAGDRRGAPRPRCVSPVARAAARAVPPGRRAAGAAARPAARARRRRVSCVVLVFALLIQSCAGSSKHDRVRELHGRRRHDRERSRRTTARQTVDRADDAGADAQPDGLDEAPQHRRPQEQQNVDAAQGLSPPGPLRVEHGNLIEALQLRVSGVNGLADTFQRSPPRRRRAVTPRAPPCSPTRRSGCSRATSSGTICSRRPR